MKQLFFIFILIIHMTFGQFSSVASESRRHFRPLSTTPTPKPPLARKEFTYNILDDQTKEKQNSEFQSNDFEFSLLLSQLDDDSSTSMSTHLMSTTSKSNLITTIPTTNEVIPESSKNTNYPSSDAVSQTFTTSSLQISSQKSTIQQDKSSSTFESQTSNGGSSSGVQGRTSISTSTPMPMDETSPTHHTMPVPEHLQKGTKAGTLALRQFCNYTEQYNVCSGEHTECRLGMCKCQLGYAPRIDNGDLCGEARNQMHPPSADPTMIGVVIGLVLMSFTLCVVMRLFAKARFQENRTIFNTPNPRLMNVSLLKGAKKGQRSRRGSQVSINSEGASAEGQQGAGPASSGNSHPKEKTSRPRPHRQPSTDTGDTVTTISEGGGGASASRPNTTSNKPKSRQESVASNSNV